MRKVFNREGVLITDPKKILHEIYNFYSNFCKQEPLSPSEDVLNSFLNNPKILKLSDNDIRICDGKSMSVIRVSSYLKLISHLEMTA